MSIIRRIGLVLLTVLFFLTAIAMAESRSGDWLYTLNDEGQAIITRYTGTARDVKLPWQLNSHLVSEIGEEAFAGTMVKTVSLPVGVTIIRWGAFRNCSQLQQIQLPQRLETIEDEAFQGCTSLALISIPESVMEIGENVFEYNTTLSGTEYSLAFAYAEACKLNYEMELPEKPKETQTTSLYQYRLEEDGAVITSYLGEESNVIVPAELDGHPVIGIGTNAFSSRYSVERVVLPEGLIYLEHTAFRFCPTLMHIEFPSTLRSIGESAFYRCENLTEVVLPEGLTDLGNRAFQRCHSLRHVTIPASVKKIPYYTFFECHASLVIYGEKGSAAENFAWSKGYQFSAIN